MLPSMPSLIFSDQSQGSCIIHEQNKESSKLASKEETVKLPEIGLNYISEIERRTINHNFMTSNCADKDDIEEINAIMIASSTVRNVREKKELNLAGKKRAKRRKQYLASLAMLLPPDPVEEKFKRDNFVQTYFEKLEETLDQDDFNKVKELFQSAEESIKNAVDLYRKLSTILVPKYQDLADEFLLFLNIEQANAVGKLIPFIIMNHMAKFLRNLESYFKDQPSQLRKIHKCLLDLNDCVDVTLEKVKSTILPLLKSNPILCDGFLQIFLEEKPTTTLFNGAWEIIDMNKESSMTDDESVFESLAVADNEDPTCMCSCHKLDEQQTMRNHCLKCGLRFVQGKIYCQTGRGLKPVNVLFPSNPEVDHNKRLGIQNLVKRLDHSCVKSLSSPSKDTLEESRLPNESDMMDRRKSLKRCRSAKITKTHPKHLSFITKKSSINKSSQSRNRTKSFNLAIECEKIEGNQNLATMKADLSSNSKDFKNFDDDMCWRNLPSPDYLDVHSSDSDFSYDEFIKEKQIKLGNSAIKNEEENSEMWTREEDKIILETFQQKIDQEAIKLIAKQLKNRSVREIRIRFEKLMTLLQEMEAS